MIWYILLPTVQSFLEKEHHDLRKNLFKNYSTILRPVLYTDTVIYVDLFVFPYKILKLQLGVGLLTGKFLIGYKWTDEYLVWNGSQFDNVSSINMPLKNVWQPHAYVCNAQKVYKVKTPIPEATVFPNGTITASTTCVYTIYCKIDNKKYPFDTQACEVHICLPLSKLNNVRIKTINTFVKELPLENWNVEINGALPNYKEGIFHATWYLSVRKLTLQPKIIILIPPILLTCVTIATFLLPPDTKQKVTFSTTSFLSIMLYLSNMSKTLASHSANHSLLWIYVLCLSCISAISCVESILVCRIHVYQNRCQMSEGKISSPEGIDPSEKRNRHSNKKRFVQRDTMKKNCKHFNFFPYKYIDKSCFVFFTLLFIIISIILNYVA